MSDDKTNAPPPPPAKDEKRPAPVVKPDPATQMTIQESEDRPPITTNKEVAKRRK
jgi:hypothetical protein